MRLTGEQIQLIRNVVHKHFGDGSRIWLFGSRTDDLALGGDIDLYIEPEPGSAENLYLTQIKARRELERRLRTAVDLVVRRDTESAFMRAAKQGGMRV